MLTFGFWALIEEVKTKGFHWFKTPFCACWLMIGYLSVFYKVLGALTESPAKSAEK